MQIRTRLLEGTTVELYFPAADGLATNIKLRPDLYDLPMAAPEECILLVEDDHIVRKLVGKILTSLGTGHLKRKTHVVFLKLRAASTC